MKQRIKANKIRRPERGAFGIPNHRTGKLIHGLNGQTHVHHGIDNAKHIIGPDPVGNKVGRILGIDNALSQHLLTYICQGLNHFRERVRIRYDLQEFHVSRGIKKVGNSKVFSEIFCPILTHGLCRNPRCI